MTLEEAQKIFEDRITADIRQLHAYLSLNINEVLMEKRIKLLDIESITRGQLDRDILHKLLFNQPVELSLKQLIMIMRIINYRLTITPKKIIVPKGFSFTKLTRYKHDKKPKKTDKYPD